MHLKKMSKNGSSGHLCANTEHLQGSPQDKVSLLWCEQAGSRTKRKLITSINLTCLFPCDG